MFAQALVAARRTVDEPREATRLHGYFILPGDLKAPIVYFVDRLRDGKSFTTRQVTAIQHGQRDLQPLGVVSHRRDGPEHQSAMPEAADPETLTTELVTHPRDGRSHSGSAARRVDAGAADRFEARRHDRSVRGEKRAPTRRAWFRADGRLPDDPWIHQAVLAYASDYGLLVTALQPHGIAYRTRGLQLASLDHSLWMHRPFRADEWLLYTMDSPVTYGARGFVRGTIHSQSGELVASVAQEGLIRLTKPTGEK